ncbi:MAG: N-6 DNA methylase [Acidobacteria bacterium]|nr:N-6 DNA methylase [Acidobacteriota bacterium]
MAAANRKSQRTKGVPEMQESLLEYAAAQEVLAVAKPTIDTALRCPIRGILNAAALAKDGLTPTEEARRIEFLHFLLERDYPPDNIAVETVVLKKLGESGRNKLRCDVIAYKIPAEELEHLSLEDRIGHAVLVAEIKRDSSKKASGIECQLEPAMRQLPGMQVMGAYWDDVHRLLFVKQLIKKNGEQHLEIISDTLSNLPRFKAEYKTKPLTYSDLDSTANIVKVLWDIANAMRSHGINDDRTRYKETVKLLLARYCDEKEGKESPDEPLALQVYPGTDPKFTDRIKDTYETAASRYSRAKTLFKPVRISELPEDALRGIVRTIQGIEFSSASNETMQQVFMSFVPAVFKKSLDQYFTPIGLINAVVQMVKVGPNDKAADPGMGTADFLTAVMDYRARLGDKDADQRVFGIDIDAMAYELAVVNMILNKDGQAGLQCEDSIASPSLFDSEMNVVLCNPPFGEKSVEKRSSVLKHYDLGHRWICGADGKWSKTKDILPYQQLGILFIERSYKMLANKGRLGIILPEGYLCTPMYGYIRQWIIDHLRILSLTELPRRIFLRSNVDLRSNILIAQKVSVQVLKSLRESNYPIHTEMVRKVGFKMGKGYQPIFVRDPETGLELRDDNNCTISDTDFRRVCDGFERFTAEMRWNQGSGIKPHGKVWDGAMIRDITSHANLDMKPRRLMPKALANVRTIQGKTHVRLGDIADVEQGTMDILKGNTGKLWRLVEGLDIRAVEGLVVPEHPARAWQIAERKSRMLFHLLQGDIIVGLVRPERRNIGVLLIAGNDVVGAPDGIAVVRTKPENDKKYPQEWLLSALRSEACRLQFWTESGGTSYGKLTNDNILDVLIPVPSEAKRQAMAEKVKIWAQTTRLALTAWDTIGAPADRFPVVNSPSFGLVELTPGSEFEDDE